jgi:hypothetical protein
MSRAVILPTLLNHPTRACPRCDRRRLRALAVNAFGAFAWHECEDCSYLWAVPQGWIPERTERLPRSAE